MYTISVGEGEKLIQIEYCSIYSIYTLSIYRHKTVDLTRMFFCLLFLFFFCLFGQTQVVCIVSPDQFTLTRCMLRRQGQAIQLNNLKRNLEQKVSHLPYLVGRHYALILVMFSDIL